MSTSTLRVVQAGCGGYGDFYLSYFLGEQCDGFELVACVDPYFGRCGRSEQIRQRGIRVFAAAEDMPASLDADVAVIVSPIHCHLAHTRAALERDMHVLCEKPLCATVQDGLAMLEAQRAAQRIVAIGYQWSYSSAIRGLKKDILAGTFGVLRRAKSLVLWPRPRSYYSRAAWAGRMRSCAGEWVLDSPVNNATSHYLHNMLFVAGDAVERSARPASVTAELYRANEIENYDTAVLRCTTDLGAELLFVTSHATDTSAGPAFECEFEHAHVSYAQGGSEVIAELADGTVRRYGSPDVDPYRKVSVTADAIRSGALLPCGIETALPQTLCMNGAQESSAVADFPPELVCVRCGDEPRAWVDGLRGVLEGCYEEWKLPSELGVPWAHQGRPVALSGYSHYPSASPPRR